MFVDHVSRRQPGHEPRQDQDARGDHPEIVDLAEAKKNVRDRIDRRDHIEPDERRKGELQGGNPVVSKETPSQPQLISHPTIKQRAGAGKCAVVDRRSIVILSLPWIILADQRRSTSTTSNAGVTFRLRPNPPGGKQCLGSIGIEERSQVGIPTHDLVNVERTNSHILKKPTTCLFPSAIRFSMNGRHRLL